MTEPLGFCMTILVIRRIWYGCMAKLSGILFWFMRRHNSSRTFLRSFLQWHPDWISICFLASFSSKAVNWGGFSAQKTKTPLCHWTQNQNWVHINSMKIWFWMYRWFGALKSLQVGSSLWTLLHVHRSSCSPGIYTQGPYPLLSSAEVSRGSRSWTSHTHTNSLAYPLTCLMVLYYSV